MDRVAIDIGFSEFVAVGIAIMMNKNFFTIS